MVHVRPGLRTLGLGTWDWDLGLEGNPRFRSGLNQVDGSGEDMSWIPFFDFTGGTVVYTVWGFVWPCGLLVDLLVATVGHDLLHPPPSDLLGIRMLKRAQTCRSLHCTDVVCLHRYRPSS